MQKSDQKDQPAYDQSVNDLPALLSEVIGGKPKLSQRALAKRISVSSGYISQVLKGQKVPSDKILIKIGNALKIKDVMLSRILAASQKARIGVSHNKLELPSTSLLASRMPSDSELDFRPKPSEGNEQFWAQFFESYELPIATAAMTLDSDKKDINWFCRTMKVSRKKALKMISTLTELGFVKLKYTPSGIHLENETSRPTVYSNIPPKTRKHLMKSFIGFVGDSLDTQPDNLPLRGIALALDPEQLPQLRTIVDEVVMKAIALSATPGPKTKLYCLQVAAIDWDSTLDSK